MQLVQENLERARVNMTEVRGAIRLSQVLRDCAGKIADRGSSPVRRVEKTEQRDSR
jgi:hypothetical protein